MIVQNADEEKFEDYKYYEDNTMDRESGNFGSVLPLWRFSTEKSRESAKIIKEQCENISKNNQDQINAMHEIKEETIKFKESLLKGDFTGIVETFKKGWELKKNTASSVSNIHLNKIHSKAINSGALAGKVSGAGGGGFMIFLVPIEKRRDLIEALQEFKGIIYNCHFTNNGCQAWHL